MFVDFYNMREQPFGCSPDTRFLYLGTSHREALASLYYAVKTHCGFTTLIADPGLGKTTLTFQLLEKLQPAARSVFLCQTQCNSRELVRYILSELGATDTGSMDIVALHSKMKEIISCEMAAGRRVILAIDEAQNLDDEVLETIRLLSNFETSRAKLLHILLIGQPQLARKLRDPALTQLRQRISVLARLKPFDLDETRRYIAHRLRVAGCSPNGLFTREAVALVSEISHGIPRNINNLCFNALTLGFATGCKQIDSQIMREVVADLDLAPWNETKLVCNGEAPESKTGAVAHSRDRLTKAWSMRFAAGTVCLAACLGASIALPSFSNRLGTVLHTKAEAAGTLQVSAQPATNALAIGSDLGTTSAADRIAESSAAGSAQSILPSSQPDTMTVVVEAGDDLRCICLRTVGQYNDTVVDKIRKLNPIMSDPNHIEAGEQIRVPRVSKPLESDVPAGPNTDRGKN